MSGCWGRKHNDVATQYYCAWGTKCVAVVLSVICCLAIKRQPTRTRLPFTYYEGMPAAGRGWNRTEKGRNRTFLGREGTNKIQNETEREGSCGTTLVEGWI